MKRESVLKNIFHDILCYTSEKTTEIKRRKIKAINENKTKPQKLTNKTTTTEVNRILRKQYKLLW